MIQNRTVKKTPWDYLLPDHVKMFGPDIQNPDKRALWCKAFLYGGNTLRLWNEALELKIALLSVCAFKQGQRVAVVGKYILESGLAEAIRSLIGQVGNQIVEEIVTQALTALTQTHPMTGKTMQWDFSYFNSMPDESLDRIILFEASPHIGNLKECAYHISRVLRDGGRVIVADAPWGGKDLLTAAHMDAHLDGFVTRILSGIGITEEELPHIGPDGLTTIFKQYLSWSRVFSWKGFYLFYGQKGGNEENISWSFPLPTEAVQRFLATKASRTPWDFLTIPEIVALGPEVREIELQKNWGRAIFFASNLVWCWENARIVKHLMYGNLKAKPGDRILVIGEVLENLGFLPELKKLTKDTGEIASFDIVSKSRSGYIQQWEMGPGVIVPEKHQWDYGFADKYPGQYFDLIWLPQGVHHARNWKEIAPRLLRVLKQGGQVMMAECRVPSPEFCQGLKMSGLLSCIVDKIFWAMDTTLEEMPDYSTGDLVQAFGDSLIDTHSLEWKGWLLFWGTKSGSF